MSVIECTEDWARDAEVNQNFERLYTRRFKVQTNSNRDGGKTVLASVPVRVGNTYDLRDATHTSAEYDLGAVCTTIKASNQPEDPRSWFVVATYGPWMPREENPLDQPPEFSDGFAAFEEIMDIDEEGTPVLNAARDYFDPPVMRDNSRPQITVTRNEPRYDRALARDMKDSVNTDTFLDEYDPGTVKTADIQARRAWHPTCGFYYIITYEFHINPEGWTKKVLNQGMRQLSGTGDRKQILDKGGVPINSPVPLDEEGLPLDPEADPILLEFVAYKRRAFSIYNISAS